MPSITIPALAVSVTEAARLAGVSRALAYREIKDRKLKAHKVAGRTVVRIADIHDWIGAVPLAA